MSPDDNVLIVSGQAQGQIPGFRADRLDAEIGSRFLTYEEAAREIGVSVRTLHRWRQGKNPQLRHLRAVASAFERDPAYFIEQDAPEDLAA